MCLLRLLKSDINITEGGIAAFALKVHLLVLLFILFFQPIVFFVPGTLEVFLIINFVTSV